MYCCTSTLCLAEVCEARSEAFDVTKKTKHSESHALLTELQKILTEHLSCSRHCAKV